MFIKEGIGKVKTRIFLVRHGETIWNANGRFQGHTDVPLSENGIAQANKLALRLKKEKIHAFYSSDLSRAKETAEILAQQHQLPVKYLPDLREINFGQWEGLTYKEISDNYGDITEQWWSNPLATQIPEGESLQEVANRCSRAIHDIVVKHSGETVVIAVHGGIIRVLISLALGIDLNNYWKLRADNVALSILEYHTPDKAILELYNDICHLS